MKKALERLMIKAAKKDFFWKLLKPVSTAGIILNNSRLAHLKQKTRSESKFDSIFKSLTVLNGPFKGLRYPSLDSVGSAIYPKLLGSYESELHETIASIIDEEYTEIIDIGCAEGYYAVGMARNYDNVKIYAFDINEKARKLCSDMAILNGVAEKIEIHSECTPELLKTFNFSQKGLIICDCEGFESELFNTENIRNLKQCDLIIELHDFIDIEISNKLKELFSRTHDVESIFSLDDIHKAQNYDFNELFGMTLIDKKRILSEWRPAIMEWIICKPKTEM